jgi:hypothetical protein
MNGDEFNFAKQVSGVVATTAMIAARKTKDEA